MDELEKGLLKKDGMEYLEKREKELIHEILLKTENVFNICKALKKRTDELQEICRLKEKIGQSI